MIVFFDELRPDADRIVERLRAEGIRHVAMVSGDRQSVAERVGRALGVDRVYAEQTPEQKLDVVRRLRDDPELRPVIMVGDGVNDAPALALADLGIAMGVAGATVSSETADAVITVDRIDRVRRCSAYRPTVAPHRATERARRDGTQPRRHGSRRRRIPHTGRRRPPPRSDRPRRHPQRTTSTARLNALMKGSRAGHDPKAGDPETAMGSSPPPVCGFLRCAQGHGGARLRSHDDWRLHHVQDHRASAR